MIKTKELRDQSEAELKVLSHTIAKELFELKNESRILRKVEKPHLFRMKRRDRARLLTVLREKEEKK